tara:strand:+ start:1712 stop:2272 length:561 start_codon:yes stop_codon:yes gene_type:complete
MEEKMEEIVQENVQELVTENQNDTDNMSDRESELLQEIMQKKERLQKAESKIAELEKVQEVERQKQLEENEEWKTLAEERAKQLSELTPVVDQYKAERTAEKEKLLSDFPEDDREEFKELTLAQLRSVHGKILKTKNNIPSVETSDSTGMQGYATLKEAVKDHVSGKIDKTTYEQIKEKFTSRINR